MLHSLMARIIACRLERVRTARGLSQRALADAAGVTRQAVGAIERGRVQPSVGIAIALARVLGVRVEELFEAPAAPQPPFFEGVAREHLAIEPTRTTLPSAFVAGCDVVAGLLARHAALRERELRVLWLPMTNRAALEQMRRGRVHAAVLHGDARERGKDDELERFELATTEEGWLIARGNPLRVRGAADLARRGLRLVNRPRGAGARALLDEQLRRARLDPARIDGYERELEGQLDAGRAIAQGFADVAVGLASVAKLFDLDFVALRPERCTLVVPREHTRSAQVLMLLDTLRSQPYRDDVRGLDAYDVSRTGERIA
ncbi:MAG TPA: substrate-binding domain-containing protein [Candidatus Acidoferrales bacterium]|nr:substrate-binding domain-containing protein [Candidatus Acidoferrales bacterium]